MDLAKKEVLKELGGFRGIVHAVMLVDKDHILAGDSFGEVRLWNATQDELVWSAKIGDPVVQFGYVAGSEFVVVQHIYRGAKILRMMDGTVLRATGNLKGMDSTARKLLWTNPYPIFDGSVALEVEQSTIEVNLALTHSGEKLLTFSALPNDQWVVYTPEGYWDGSESIHEYVKFYCKDKLLVVHSAEKFRGRDKIEAVLARTFKVE